MSRPLTRTVRSEEHPAKVTADTTATHAKSERETGWLCSINAPTREVPKLCPRPRGISFPPTNENKLREKVGKDEGNMPGDRQSSNLWKTKH